MDTSREQADAEVGSAGFAVSPGDLQRAAGRAATLAMDLGSVTARWLGEVGAAGMAMPEPASTTLLGEVGAALGRVLAARGRELEDLAAGLRAAASSYTGTDTVAGDAAGRIGRELGEYPADSPADSGDHPGGRGPR